MGLAKQIQYSALLGSDGCVLFQHLCTHSPLCGSSALEMEHKRLHKSQAHLDPGGFLHCCACLRAILLSPCQACQQLKICYSNS